MLTSLLLAAALAASHAGAPRPKTQNTRSVIPKEARAHKDQRMEWWRDARLGMFIHWGLYSIPAGTWNGKTDYAEWIREEAHIPVG